MRPILFAIFLSLFISNPEMALSQNDSYVTEVSYYDGLGKKMRQEMVYRTNGKERKLVGRRIYVDETNELRELMIEDEKGAQQWYGGSKDPSKAPPSHIALMKKYFSNIKVEKSEVTPQVSKENPSTTIADVGKDKECDPENTSSFMEVCANPSSSKVPGEVDFLPRYPWMHKRLTGQGTDPSEYQIIDCDRGSVLNVEKSNEKYSCFVKDFKKNLLAAKTNGQDDKSYDPDTCEWSEEIPRRLANAPGCSATAKIQVCVGYVVCKQKDTGIRMMRMSTCSPENCGEQDAKSCTKEEGYSSTKPKNKMKVKKSSTSSSQASDQ